jgi:hypothetical protein
VKLVKAIFTGWNGPLDALGGILLLGFAGLLVYGLLVMAGNSSCPFMSSC